MVWVPVINRFALRTAEFTGAHGKEEGATDKVCSVRVDQEEGIRDAIRKVKEVPEEARGYGALAFWGRVCGIIGGAEKRTDGGRELVAAQEVKGALFEMLPKRSSQMACGFTDSV
jgi:hypothetical protein